MGSDEVDNAQKIKELEEQIKKLKAKNANSNVSGSSTVSSELSSRKRASPSVSSAAEAKTVTPPCKRKKGVPGLARAIMVAHQSESRKQHIAFQWASPATRNTKANIDSWKFVKMRLTKIYPSK